MKIQELKSLTLQELEAKGRDFRQELFNLRLRQTAGQLEQPSRLRELKKGIARVETFVNQLKRKTVETKK